MTQDPNPFAPVDDANGQLPTLQQEILAGRPFSLAEVIGREGGSFLKGESLIPRGDQAINAILVFIDQHLVDSVGALQATLQELVKADNIRISQHLEAPLIALQAMLAETLDSATTFYELVRQVDMRWGEIYGERPYFQQPGHPPHPDDEYTHESVRLQLTELLQQVIRALNASTPQADP